MQYTEGQLGRVFVVRIDDGEDMLDFAAPVHQSTKVSRPARSSSLAP